MPIAKETGGDFTPAPAGTHLARCIGCVSLGTQPQNNPKFDATFKIMLVWELPDELLDGGKAMTVSRELTCSLSEKANLRHLLESWRGKSFTREELDGFDVQDVVDVPCMITVIHKTSAKGRTYAEVSAVTKLPKSVPAKARVNELVRYEIEDGKNAVYESLPEFVRKKIASCAEWIAQPAQEAQPDAPPDDYYRSVDETPHEDSSVPF